MPNKTKELRSNYHAAPKTKTYFITLWHRLHGARIRKHDTQINRNYVCLLFFVPWFVFGGSVMVNIDEIVYLTKCTKEARRTYARAFGYPVPDFSIQVSASTLRGLATQLNKSIKGEGNELSIEYNDVKFCSPKKEVQ